MVNFFQNIFKKKQPVQTGVVQNAQAQKDQAFRPTVAKPTGVTSASYANPYQSIMRGKPPVATPQPKAFAPGGAGYVSPAVRKITQPTIKKPFVNLNSKSPEFGVANLAYPRSSRYTAPAPEAVPNTSPIPPASMDPAAQLRGYYDSSESGQMQGVDDQYNTDSNYIQSMYDKRAEFMKGQIPESQAAFNTFRTGVEGGIADQEKNAVVERDQVAEQSGTSQRQLAQAKRQVAGQREKQYAALGSVDSFGTGSFTEANTNDDADFMRMTNENLNDRDNKIFRVNQELSGYKRNAQGLIDTENAKLRQTIAGIQNDMSMNDDEKNYALRSAYNEAKSIKTGIKSEYQGRRMELEQSLLEKNTAVADPAAAESLRKEFASRTTGNNFTAVQQAYAKISKAPETAAGDLGLIFAYMKLLDPTSTVREGEFANAQNATGVPQRVLNQYNQAMAGQRINQNQRKEFREAALSYVQPVIDQQKQAENYYTQIALSQGIDPAMVIGGYGQLNTSPSGGATSRYQVIAN